MAVGDVKDLRFDNCFVRELKGDPEVRNFVRQVTGACYSLVAPTAVANPKLVGYAREVGDLLDLQFDPFATDEFAQVFAGNHVLPGMKPFAMCYGGHQFGSWAGQLGDGRAINLGEVVNRRGERWMLQLKGAGPTPYSRTADGLAVLRSSVREFLCSEAMFHLGVPTTRALSLCLTGKQVARDMFYDGNPQWEPGAVVCRVAPSFTRFGNFQIFSARGDHSTLKQLCDHTILTDFPHWGEPSQEVYHQWFLEVCRTTATMIVDWLRVGFVHGVMNTDNMSILGLTIDYGPYGWLENYDPNWTPNTTDAGGRRYCFGQQPEIALWNLVQLANALMPVFSGTAPLQAGIDLYARSFQKGWQSMMAAKLGLSEFDPSIDEELVDELQAVLQLTETDMTIFYRRLADFIAMEHSKSDDDGRTSDNELLLPLLDAYYIPDELTGETLRAIASWLRRYRWRCTLDPLPGEVRRERMNATNPKYVLRNYLAQMAIDQAEAGNYALIQQTLEVLRKPYDDQPGKDSFAGKRPEWARHRAGCSMLSCSS